MTFLVLTQDSHARSNTSEQNLSFTTHPVRDLFKDVCGNDFLKKIRSGEVGISLVDTENVYSIRHKYYKSDGKYTMGGFSFELTDVVTKDTPWSFKQGKIFENI